MNQSRMAVRAANERLVRGPDRAEDQGAGGAVRRLAHLALCRQGGGHRRLCCGGRLRLLSLGHLRHSAAGPRHNAQSGMRISVHRCPVVHPQGKVGPAEIKVWSKTSIGRTPVVQVKKVVILK